MADILSLKNDIEPFVGKDCCSNPTDVRLLTMIRQWVESAAKQYVKHPILQATITNEYQRRQDIGDVVSDWQMYELVGDKVYESQPIGAAEGQILQLDNGFVRSVSDCREDLGAQFGLGTSDFDASTALTQGTDFTIELDSDGLCKSGRLIRINRNWSSTPGTIRITYITGFTVAELNGDYSFVKLALLEDVQAKFNTAKSQQSSGGGPLRKIVIHGDVTEEYATTGSTTSLMGLSPGAMQKLNPIKATIL